MLEVFDRASCAMKLMLRDRDLNVFEGVQTETEAVHLLAKGEAAREGNRILAGKTENFLMIGNTLCGKFENH